MALTADEQSGIHEMKAQATTAIAAAAVTFKAQLALRTFSAETRAQMDTFLDTTIATALTTAEAAAEAVLSS